MLSVNFNLSSTLDLYLEPSPPPLFSLRSQVKKIVFFRKEINSQWFIEYLWSGWADLVLGVGPPALDLPPGPLHRPLPLDLYLHLCLDLNTSTLLPSLTIVGYSFEFLLLDLLQNSFLCVARMTASWAEHTHILHSPFLDTLDPSLHLSLQLSLHLHLDLSIILSLDLFLDPFLDLNNGFGFNIGFFSSFGGERWGIHAKWERSRGSDKYQRTWILPELYNNRM